VFESDKKQTPLSTFESPTREVAEAYEGFDTINKVVVINNIK